MKERHRCTAHSTAAARSDGPSSGNSRNSHCSLWGIFGRNCRGADALTLSQLRFLSSFETIVWNFRYTLSIRCWRAPRASSQSSLIGSEISSLACALGRLSWVLFQRLCPWKSCWARRRSSDMKFSRHRPWRDLNLSATVMIKMADGALRWR